MKEQFEIDVGEYGRRIFEAMTGDRDKYPLPEHWGRWESIAAEAEAEPLVQKLLALNEKMNQGLKISLKRSPVQKPRKAPDPVEK